METPASLKAPDNMGNPLSLEILKPVDLLYPLEALYSSLRP